MGSYHRLGLSTRAVVWVADRTVASWPVPGGSAGVSFGGWLKDHPQWQEGGISGRMELCL